jgi:ubiquitin carboxyl-terminal hydrolase 16/45
MADEGEEPKERPRKSPRLDLNLLVDASAVAAPEVSNLREGGAEGTSDNKQCNHVPTDSAHMRMLSSSLLSLRAARCKLCVHPIEGTHILVCLECGRHFCSGVGSVEYPYGHSRAHAWEQQHWVAALSEDPKSAFCFNCDSVVNGPPHTTTELLAAAEANSGSSDVSWPDSDISVANEPCTHVPTDSAHMKLLESSLISEHAGKCVLCKTFKLKESGIMVCMECGLHFCTGIGSVDSPSGHSRLHAKQKQHWVAALFDEPQSAYCFKCEYVVCVAEPPDDVETDGFKAGGHALGLSLDLSNLIQGLSNTFGSAHIHGYAIRGIPNMGNTCYFNAVVQCLLVLDKLRARMFEPDASKGLFAESLRELFVGTSAAGSLLNPEKLLQLLCMYQKDFRGYGMHDSHELLLALLNAMDEDEKNTRDKQNSAPEVIKTIFGVQMCERRTCRCLCNSVSHPDRELNLSLPLVQRHPVVSAAPRGTCENSKSQLNMVSTQLFPTNKLSKSERIQTVAEGGDSHLPCSELKDVVVVEKPGPLEVGEFICFSTYSKSLTADVGGVSLSPNHATIEEWKCWTVEHRHFYG